MADFNLLVLGPVSLEKSDGERVGRPGAKAKALLAYLASQPNGRADREILARLLWDCCTQAEARHSLRQTLLTLRVQLGEYADAVLKSDRHSLQLRLEALDVDLLRFECAVQSQNDRHLIEAWQLWRGPFCDGLDVGTESFEDWLLLKRAQLDELAAAGFKRVAEAQLSAGRFESAVSAAQRCVALNPFDDGAHAMLIDLYRQRGWIGPARAAYRRCVELFRRELGETPDEMVEKALIGGPENAPYCADANSGPVSRDPGGLLALPVLERRVSPARRVPVFTHYAKAAALTVAVTLIAMVGTKVFVGNEAIAPVVMPAVQTPKYTAWVGASVGDAHAGANLAFPSQSSRKVFGEWDNHQVSVDEAISRALRLDPAYAHLYPAGC